MRVIEYQVPDREGDETGELICLITTILEHGVVPAMTNSPPTSPPSATSIPSAEHRSYPGVVKRARHNSYRVKRPGDTGTRHDGPSTIELVNAPDPRSMITLR